MMLMFILNIITSSTTGSTAALQIYINKVFILVNYLNKDKLIMVHHH